jgi:hypothetical protein
MGSYKELGDDMASIKAFFHFHSFGLLLVLAVIDLFLFLALLVMIRAVEFWKLRWIHIERELAEKEGRKTNIADLIYKKGNPKTGMPGRKR